MSYEEEKKALLEEFRQKSLEVGRKYPYTGGRDGRGTVEDRKIAKEFNEAARKLREKYGIMNGSKRLTREERNLSESVDEDENIKKKIEAFFSKR